MNGLLNNILSERDSGELGFPWAIVIPAVASLATGVTSAVLASRTAKKNNQAAKELAAMQIAAQQQSQQNQLALWAAQQQQQQSTTSDDDKEKKILYAALIGMGLLFLLKR